MSEPTIERKMSTASERMARRAMLKARLNAKSPTTERRASDAEITITPKRSYKRPVSPGPTFLDVEAAASPFTRHYEAHDASIEQVASNNVSRHSSARRRSSLSLSPGLEELPPDAERAERRRRIAEKAEELLSKGVPQRESGRLSAVSRSSSVYLDGSNPFGDSVSKLRRSSIQQDGESGEESGRASAPLDESYASFGCEKYEQGRYSPAEASSPITVAVRRLSTENIKVLTNNTKPTNNNNSSSSKGLRPRDSNSANRVITSSATKECSVINNIQTETEENDEIAQSNKLIMDVDSPRAGRATQPFDGTSHSAKADVTDGNDVSAAAVVAAASDIRLPSPSPHQQDEGAERALSVASDVPAPQEKTASPDRRTRDQVEQSSSPVAPALGITPMATTALTEHASAKEYGSMSATLPPETTEKTTTTTTTLDETAPPVPLQEQGAAVPIRVAKESPTGEGPALPSGQRQQGKKGGNDKDVPLIEGDDNNEEGSGSHSNKNRKGKKNNKRDILVPGSEVKAQAEGVEEPQCCCNCCNCCKCCRSCCRPRCEIM